MAKLTMAEAKRIMADNNGDLDLYGRRDITELPKGLKVDGFLDLRGTRITELPEGLTVGDWFNLSDTGIIKLPEGLTVGGSLYLSRCKNIRELPEGLTVGGWINLNYTPIYELPVGLTVIGCLDLSGTPIHELPEGLTVGGSLDLYNTNIDKLPKDLKIGKDIYDMKNIVKKTDYKQLQNGDYVPGKYIYADGILTFIKGVHKIGQYTVYVGKFKDRNVVSDGTYYAYCSNIRDGIADIAFKKLKDRGTAQYESLDLNSAIPFEEAVIMYRIVTGACRQGTKDFLDSQKELKKEYTVAEIIEATKGQYGHETFVRFFKNR